jgi:hypothetical protein
MQTNRERTIRAHFRSLKFLRKTVKEEELVCVKTNDDDEHTYFQVPRRKKRRGYSCMEEAQCGMCLDTYKPDDKVVFSRHIMCGHHFHQSCILKWVRLSLADKCPICTHTFKR